MISAVSRTTLFLACSVFLFSSLNAFSMRTQKVKTSLQDVTCTYQWLTQKDTLKLLQSNEYSTFIQETHKLKSYVVPFITVGLVLVSAALLLASDRAGGGNNHTNTHIHVIPGLGGDIIPSSSEASLPILSDFSNVTLENIHRHVTPVKVKIENTSDEALIIPKDSYLPSLQKGNIKLDSLLHLFPKIENERLPMYFATAGYGAIALLGGAVAGITTSNIDRNPHGFWRTCGTGLELIACGVIAVLAAISAKFSYNCWNSVSTLNELNKNHDSLVGNLSVLYDPITGKELALDEYSFGFIIPPHTTFEDLIFIRSEGFILHGPEQDSIMLNAQQLPARNLQALTEGQAN